MNPYQGGYKDPRQNPSKGMKAEDFLANMKMVYSWANIEEFFAEFAKPTPKDRGKLPAGKLAVIKGTMRKVRLGFADAEMKEQLKKFSELYQFIKATVNSKLPKVEYRPKVVGSRANIAGIVVGDPRTALGRKPAVEADKRRAKSNLVRLCCNVDAFAGVGANFFFIRGAAMCALAEALEAAKYRVEITIAIASTPLQRPSLVAGGTKLQWTSYYDYTSANDAKAAVTKNQRYFVKLKPFATPIAPLQVAFAMMHPAVLRTLFFAFWHHYLPYETGEQQRWYDDGYGSVGVVPEGHDGTYDIYVEGFDPHNPASSYSDKEGAVRWILETLNNFGISTSK